MLNKQSGLIVHSNSINLHHIGTVYFTDIGSLTFAGMPAYLPDENGKMDLIFNFQLYRSYSPTSAIVSIFLQPTQVYVICDNKNDKSWSPTIGLLKYSAEVLANKWKTDLLLESENFCSQKEKYQTDIKQARVLTQDENRELSKLYIRKK
ncbi:hypothetical protein [Leptospira sp. GIMC2001]|uniref:hypothetical protein n=1 Tax=Leptospira sp. GIMC2001 TaxID=1513297 RepID=UPI002349396C|nr:hypothetical protein [Leptospira sp. GIMC2001]WCL48416.1 hypothetical protein O4O04_14040 [Leptospira sp. GIMC2001]